MLYIPTIQIGNKMYRKEKGMSEHQFKFETLQLHVGQENPDPLP